MNDWVRKLVKAITLILINFGTVLTLSGVGLIFIIYHLTPLVQIPEKTVLTYGIPSIVAGIGLLVGSILYENKQL